MKFLLNNITGFFMHPNLTREDSLHEKSKMLIIVLFAVFIMLFLYTVYFLVNGVILNTKAIENYVAVTAAFVCLMVIRRTGNINFPLYLLTILGYVFITTSAYLSGGIYSNDISWYFVIPVASLMLISIRAGIAASVVSLLFTTAFYALEINHHKDFIHDSLSYGLGYKFANSFFILTLLMLVMFILVRSNKRLQRIIQHNREQQIREDIARDFHDQIGNKLASIQHLTALSKMNRSEEEKKVILDKIGNNAKEVYDNFKDFIWTKDPQSDQLKEVFMYLHDFAEDYLKHSNINLFINSSTRDMPEIIFPPDWSKELVPMFKEVITNAYKHSKATNIWFDFIFNDNKLQIRVKDDGIGINTPEQPTGKGLRNIKHRAEVLGGTLQIISAPGEGTEIIFSAVLPNSGSIMY